MTKEEMIKVIYEKIADKTLSKWCLLQEIVNKELCITILEKLDEKTNRFYWETTYKTISRYLSSLHWWVVYSISDTTISFIEKWYKIIWHPVMIWDCLSYINYITIWVDYTTKDILIFWTKKRKPIEEQSDDCITYIYNLIK